MLRPEESGQFKEIAIQSLENLRSMLERRRNRRRMEQGGDPRAAKLFWPKFSQMIEWKLNRHA